MEVSLDLAAMNLLVLYKSGALGDLDFTIPFKEGVKIYGQTISGMVCLKNKANGFGIYNNDV